MSKRVFQALGSTCDHGRALLRGETGNQFDTYCVPERQQETVHEVLREVVETSWRFPLTAPTVIVEYEVDPTRDNGNGAEKLVFLRLAAVLPPGEYTSTVLAVVALVTENLEEYGRALLALEMAEVREKYEATVQERPDLLALAREWDRSTVRAEVVQMVESGRDVPLDEWLGFRGNSWERFLVYHLLDDEALAALLHYSCANTGSVMRLGTAPPPYSTYDETLAMALVPEAARRLAEKKREIESERGWKRTAEIRAEAAEEMVASIAEIVDRHYTGDLVEDVKRIVKIAETVSDE